MILTLNKRENIRAFFEDDSVLAFFTDRKGGISKAPFDSLNVGENVGDNIKNIIQNRQIIADANGFLLDNLVYMKQIHSNNVKIVRNSFILKKENVDALITDKRKIPLMVMVADCAPILIYDKIKKVIAVVHSGRVGTFKGIVRATIDKMKNRFGTSPKDIMVHVGASIGKCCYEVDKNIANCTKKNFAEVYIIQIKNKYFLDIKTMIKDQLLSLKVLKENIKISKICTSCNKDYFSYRREGTTGRFCGIIMLN